jgi:hypothetical protein
MTILSRSGARRLIASHYPAMPFKIRSRQMSFGARRTCETICGLPTLAWQALTPGSDSAVRIGVLLPSGDVDWSADVRPHKPVTKEISR